MRIDAYGIVFADMDGTFLATDKSVPAANLRLLDELVARNIPFVPCTGRPISGIPEELLAHPATKYAVGANGAVIVDVASGKNLREAHMDKEQVLKLYDLVCNLRVTFDVFTEKGVFAERERYEAMSNYGLDPHLLAVLRRVRQPLDLTVPEIVESADMVVKVTSFWSTEQDREGLRAALEQLEGVSVTNGDPRDYEIQALGASKGAALRWLCSYAQIPMESSVAFGDQGNDIPLLEAAGDGVAMANADELVRAKARHVTCSCDEAGVARYLFGD